jgi:hypothetical protein
VHPCIFKADTRRHHGRYAESAKKRLGAAVSIQRELIMKATLQVINQMQASGVIGRYAIGGAVGATFYLEPAATLDIDIFASIQPPPGSVLLSLQPIYDYLVTGRHYRQEGEYIVVEGWQVQFLPPGDALGEEALAQAIAVAVEEVTTWVMTAEHLVALALQLGRGKDFARILQFIEAGVLESDRLDQVLTRHHLLAKWEQFGDKFLRNK